MISTGVVQALAIGISLVASSLEAGPPEGVNLARMSGWDIVVAEDATASEKYAASEFQELFAAASGQKLPFVTAAKGAGKHVYIGPGDALRSSSVGFDVTQMGQEDLRIVIRDDVIAIAGGRQRGTLYGVYVFLEDYLGVRFLTHDHTHVPAVGDWRVVGPVDRFHHPPLSFRACYYEENHVSPAFAVRLRNNSILDNTKLEGPLGGASGIKLINHTHYRLVPTADYGKDHPEYFALVDGRRLSQVGDDARQTELCMTNPQLVPIVAKKVLEHIGRHPGDANVSVSQNDGNIYCRCGPCSAVTEREGSPMGPLLEFVNAVADEVAAEHPDIKVGTLAYLFSRKAPKTLRPRPNVQIMLSTIECSILQPIDDPKSKLNRSLCEDLVAWGKICDDILIWNYNVNYHCYQWPVPNLRVIEPNIRFFVQNGARGVFMQAAGESISSDISDLRNYVICRLLWNPNLRGQDLIDEFLDLHYQSAAPPIRRYLNLMHDRVAAKGIERNCFGSARRHFGIDETIVAAGLAAYDEALQLADDDVIRARVEKASISVYGAALEEAYRWAWANVGGVRSRPRQPAGASMPEDLARTNRGYVRKFFELCDAYRVTHWHEGSPMQDTRNMMRIAFGLEEKEAF
jgi:hypothetical protein